MLAQIGLLNKSNLKNTRTIVRCLSPLKNYSSNVEHIAETAALTTAATEFLTNIHRKFDEKRKTLLNIRRQRQATVDAGKLPNFSENTSHIRESQWTVAKLPDQLKNPRVELIAPALKKFLRKGPQAGADVFVVDFEDALCPTWENIFNGQRMLYNILKNRYTAGEHGESLFAIRPRGLHLDEKHVVVDDLNGHTPISATFFDAGLYIFLNAKNLQDNGHVPYLYLPKLESYQEAELCNEMFQYCEKRLQLAPNIIKVTFQLEHVMAALELEEIVHVLKDRIVCIHCAVQDYAFSYVKTFRNYANRMMPDRSSVTITSPFMKACIQHVIDICQRRGAQAMTGTGLNLPSKKDMDRDRQKVIELVRREKLAERMTGFHSTGVAHPKFIPIIKEVFHAPLVLSSDAPKVATTANDLLACPSGVRTEYGLRRLIAVILKYFSVWLNGLSACVSLYDSLEDVATVELGRALLWQWIHKGAHLQDKQLIDLRLIEKIIDEEIFDILCSKRFPDIDKTDLNEAGDFLKTLLRSNELDDFFTIQAYDKLIAKGK